MPPTASHGSTTYLNPLVAQLARRPHERVYRRVERQPRTVGRLDDSQFGAIEERCHQRLPNPIVIPSVAAAAAATTSGWRRRRGGRHRTHVPVPAVCYPRRSGGRSARGGGAPPPPATDSPRAAVNASITSSSAITCSSRAYSCLAKLGE